MNEERSRTFASPWARAVLDAYHRGEEDEAMEPLVLFDAGGKPAGAPEPGDSLIFYDIRGEREVEISRAFVEKGFPHFPVREDLDLAFVTMIRYPEDLDARAAFPPPEAGGGGPQNAPPSHFPPAAGRPA